MDKEKFKQSIKILDTAYTLAVKDNKKVIYVDKKPMLVSYAKYLLEHLKNEYERLFKEIYKTK